MSAQLYSPEKLKQQAKRLCKTLDTTLSQAQETIAEMHGFPNWPTLLAKSSRAAKPEKDLLFTRKVRDWQVVDGQSVPPGQEVAGRIEFRQGGYDGVWVDAFLPNGDNVLLMLDFHSGALEISCHKPEKGGEERSCDEPDAHIHIDRRGVHVASNNIYRPHAQLFTHEAGGMGALPWSPDPSVWDDSQSAPSKQPACKACGRIDEDTADENPGCPTCRENSVKLFKEEGFICTDPDQQQYRRDNPDGTFSFCQLGHDGAWVEETIDLKDYSAADINSAVASFYSSADEVHEEYGEDANAIIAECLFEEGLVG